MRRPSIIREMTIMTAAAYVDRARTWAKRLEDGESVRSGTALRDARKTIARKTGIAPGTLENLRNGRIKAIAVHVFDALRGAVERELLSEIARLEHDLQVIRQTGVDAREDQVGAVERHLAEARRALKGD